jgi:hypothetical protein
MTPIALTDAQLREVQQAASMVLIELRGLYLERVADQLRGKDLGDGLVHRIAYEVARTIMWDAGRVVEGPPAHSHST